jgi:hypothetical protein
MKEVISAVIFYCRNLCGNCCAKVISRLRQKVGSRKSIPRNTFTCGYAQSIKNSKTIAPFQQCYFGVKNSANIAK